MHIIADLIIILLITHTIISGYHALRPLYVNCFFHRYTSIAFSTHEKKTPTFSLMVTIENIRLQITTSPKSKTLRRSIAQPPTKPLCLSLW